jgi:hypothetical protein
LEGYLQEYDGIQNRTLTDEIVHELHPEQIEMHNQSPCPIFQKNGKVQKTLALEEIRSPFDLPGTIEIVLPNSISTKRIPHYLHKDFAKAALEKKVYSVYYHYKTFSKSFFEYDEELGPILSRLPVNTIARIFSPEHDRFDPEELIKRIEFCSDFYEHGGKKKLAFEKLVRKLSDEKLRALWRILTEMTTLGHEGTILHVSIHNEPAIRIITCFKQLFIPPFENETGLADIFAEILRKTGDGHPDIFNIE